MMDVIACVIKMSNIAKVYQDVVTVVSSITEERKREIIVEFIQYVFGEVQTEGWKTRRAELFPDLYEWRSEHEITDDMTFGRATADYGGDVDEVIHHYFNTILSNPNWLEEWVYYAHPELDQREEGEYWNGWDMLYELMCQVNFVKEILGLDFELK